MSKNVTLNEESGFRFACHEGLPCFGTCCRDINIYLSPYDVVRLKNVLGLSSGEFLRKYTLVVEGRGFPIIQINMREEDDIRCPFINAGRCTVYEERPWACRMAPLDIKGEGVYGFIFNKDFCRGLEEQQEWTPASWMRNQGLAIYDRVEALFKEMPERVRFTGLPSLDAHLRWLLYMVCYDVDRFREYVFNTDFKDCFGDLLYDECLGTDDTALLDFGFRWMLSRPDMTKTIRLRDQLGAATRPGVGC